MCIVFNCTRRRKTAAQYNLLIFVFICLYSTALCENQKGSFFTCQFPDMLAKLTFVDILTFKICIICPSHNIWIGQTAEIGTLQSYWFPDKVRTTSVILCLLKSQKIFFIYMRKICAADCFLPSYFYRLISLTFDKFIETNIGPSVNYHSSSSKPPLDVFSHRPRVHVGVKSTSFKVAEKDMTQLLHC